MKNLKSILLMITICVFTSGCIQSQQAQPVIVTAHVPEPQYTEATLIPGKTTKTEVLKIFGHPDDMTDYGHVTSGMPVEMIDSSLSECITYDYGDRSPLEGAKIRYVQRDGTELGIILQAGTKKTSMVLCFNGKGILLSANFL